MRATLLLLLFAPTAHAASDADAVVAETRALLDGLVAVDTSHGHESDALRPIAERLRQAGITAEILESSPGRGNLIARLPADRRDASPAGRKEGRKGRGPARPLLLLAHVDVVPVEGQPWTVPPFHLTEKEG